MKENRNQMVRVTETERDMIDIIRAYKLNPQDVLRKLGLAVRPLVETAGQKAQMA